MHAHSYAERKTLKDPIIIIKGIRVRKSLIKRYEIKREHVDNDGPDGVLVFLTDGKNIVDWEMTVEDMDKLMEEA